MYDDKVIPRQELLDAVKWADALCVMVTDKIDREIIFANPNLRVISNYAVGFDNIDMKAASERKLPVTNTPDVLTDGTAEHTIALMVSLARSIVEADKFVREGKFKEWSPNIFLGSDLKGKTLGIIGLGRIGKAVAKITLDGFDMNVVYYSRQICEDFENKNIKFTELDKLLKTSDFVSIHTPLDDSTKHLIDKLVLGLGVQGKYHVRDIVDQRLKKLFLLVKRHLSELALGDVHPHPDGIEGLAVLRFDQLHTIIEIAVGAVGDAPAIFVLVVTILEEQSEVLK